MLYIRIGLRGSRVHSYNDFRESWSCTYGFFNGYFQEILTDFSTLIIIVFLHLQTCLLRGSAAALHARLVDSKTLVFISKDYQGIPTAKYAFDETSVVDTVPTVLINWLKFSGSRLFILSVKNIFLVRHLLYLAPFCPNLISFFIRERLF